MRQSIDKGCHGHLDEYKRIRMTHMIIIAVIMIILIVLSFMIFGSRRSFLTILACVMSIPLAERLIGFGIVAKYKSLPKDIYDAFAAKPYGKKLIYDITVSNGEKILYLPAVYVDYQHIAIYFDNKSYDEAYYKKALAKVFEVDEDIVSFLYDIESFDTYMAEVEEDAPDKTMQEMLLVLGV